ncbi:MAG: hypothetical protein OXM02_00645 [Bacteroidota bacterium]|nr:hypothetical protein [Bacteroidota bacterium]
MAEIISPPEVRSDPAADRLAAIEAEIRGLRSDMSHQRERMDDRFEAQEKRMDDRFKAQEKRMDDRFKAQEKLMNDRFEAQEKLMNARIDEVKSVTTAQFADVGKQLGMIKWMIGLGVPVIIAILGALFGYLVSQPFN